MRTGIKYVIGIVLLILLGVLAYQSGNVSPQLVVFFGFILGYAAAVLVLFWILARYGA